jgi:hypothetical protein
VGPWPVCVKPIDAEFCSKISRGVFQRSAGFFATPPGAARFFPYRPTASQFEDDDLIPVCLGGNNASPLNHWPQALGGEWSAERKDGLEKRVCSEICLTRDDAQLARYQAAFAKNWVALYRQITR